MANAPNNSGIPTLKTARLTLRPPRFADYPAYLEIIASPRAKYMGGPYSGWAAWGMLCHEIALWELFGHGGLSIERTSDGAWLGVVEINDGPIFPEKELGWMLAEAGGGQGYATEAAEALRDWAFATLGLGSLVSYCDPENARSIAVAKRLGGVPDGTAPRQDPGDLVFRYKPA
jgi:RimJ/RimL family protein N-acetyltransferase